MGTFVDATGNVYVADSSASVVRFVDGTTPTLGSRRSISTYAGNGHVSYADAPSPTAGELLQPAGIATASTGELIIADTGSSLLRGVPSGFTSLITVAGSPEFGGFVGDGGPATASVVNNALAIDFDATNNGYIADTDNCIVRKINGGGNISTIAGTIPTIPNPVDPEITNPVCGFAGAGGLALSATFGKINGIAVDSHGNVFFSDATNNIVWELVVASPAAGQTVGHVYIVAGTQTAIGSFGGDNGAATAAQLHTPTGLFIDSFDNLFIADSANHVIREVPATTANGMTKGNIYTVAGTGNAAGFSGDGAFAKSAKLNTPFGIFVDSNLNLFIADTNNHVVREVPSNHAGGKTAGFIYTVAGTPQSAQFDGDGGVATSAHLAHPKGLTQGPTNSLLIADSDNNRIRSVSNATSNPSLSLSTYALNFANQPVGLASTPKPVIITNADNIGLTLAVVSTAVTGTNAADFAVTNVCDNKALAAAANCTINVTFTPSVTAAEAATLTIADTLGDTRTVALTGTGVVGVPGAQVSPTTLTFASQVVNTQSAGQDVTLTNNGTGTLTGVTISIAAPGANLGDFSQTNTCGATVNVGANCTITVKFKPTATGARAATLNIVDSAASSPQTVALTGTAVAPGVQLSGTTLTFASQVVSTTSAAQSVTLTNNGTSVLTITGITVTGANAADFAETDNCAKNPTTIAINGTCTINVKFTPAATGARTATVNIADDASVTAQTITLNGTGANAAPAVGLSNNSLTFADQFVGTTSATAQTVTVTNNGTAPLVISNVAATGAYSQTNTCTTVAAGANCTVSVKFTPTAAGANAGSITITDNATPTTQTVTLGGNGFTVSLGAASGGSTSATVKAGGTATYNLQFATSATTSTTPITITVACSDPASKSTCNAPASVTLTPGTPLAYAVTVSTTATSMMAPQSEPNTVPPANLPLGTLTIIALLFCIATMTAAAKNPAFRIRAIRVTLTACLLLMPIAAGSMLTGCASSGGSSSTPPPVVPGTPANTYTVVITPTVGGVAQAATNLTLIVQ